MKDVLTEAMDIDGLKRVLRDMNEGRIRCIAVDTPVPSQFSHEILNANPYAYLDDAPLEERRARAVEMRRILPESVLEEVGKLDPEAIAQVRQEAWPDVRDADELHDVLHTLIALPQNALGQPISAEVSADEFIDAQPELSSALALVEVNRRASLDRTAEGGRPYINLADGRSRLYANLADWRAHFERLFGQNRAGCARFDGRIYWVAAERVRSLTALFPGASFEPELPEIESSAPSRDDALLATVSGWMTHLGPATATELGDLLGLPSSDVEKALLRLEASGAVLRGKFTDSHTGETEWCERRLLARIHRLTVATLRKQIEPVTAAQFMRWLLRWQHVAPGTQVLAERGLLEVLRQLQGFEIPASAWERHILARRVANYDPKWLDQLCLTGAVGWGRLSPHPATLEDSSTGKRRVIPTSVAPITFFVREDADWMTSHNPAADQPEARGLSHGAKQVLDFLRQRGASFFADIVRGTGKLKAEIETALWELVSAGVVTADGFDNLRALIDPKRRAGQGRGRECRPRHSTGRWALLLPAAEIKPGDSQQAVESMARALLARYGVVFRELLARESFPVTWRALWTVFRRLEDRGEVRGGRFVDGFLGEQFALPVAVDSLRASRRAGPTGETIPVSAADPMNLVGIVVPGERVPANSGRTVAFRGGVVIPNGERAAVIRMTASGSENAERWAFTMRISSAWKCVSRMEPHCFSA